MASLLKMDVTSVFSELVSIFPLLWHSYLLLAWWEMERGLQNVEITDVSFRCSDAWLDFSPLFLKARWFLHGSLMCFSP